MWKKIYNELLLYVHCFHYIDCLRIVRSWVILNMLQRNVKLSTLETAARGFMDPLTSYSHIMTKFSKQY